jgi:hypothetical protein
MFILSEFICDHSYVEEKLGGFVKGLEENFPPELTWALSCSP